MINVPEFRPKEVFECDDYLYCEIAQAEAYRHIIAEDLKLPPPARILDIGCGLGTMVRHFRQSGYEAYGVESRDTVPADNQIFFREDARHTHFPDDHFDVVTEKLVLAQLIHHNRRADVARDIFTEIRRVTKPGGYFVTRSWGEVLEKSGFDYKREAYLRPGAWIHAGWWAAFRLS